MAENALKDKLIDKLWLPVVREGGKIIYPRLINKKMKLLTLTNDKNFQEISKFEENSLTRKEHVLVWAHGHIKKLRLETEVSPAKVLGPTRYENFILSSRPSVSDYFPFDIINLDFYSQDPEMEAGRIEKEIECLEKTIHLQRECGDKKIFVLIYTTLLNFSNLNYKSIVNTLGLPSQNFPSSITDQMKKIKCIEYLLSKICLKHDYNNKFQTQYYSLNKEKYICSIAGLVRR